MTRRPRPVKAVKAWAISHGRFGFIDYTRVKKRHAIAAYVNYVDDGWTWKRLYAAGARTLRVTVLVPITPDRQRKK